MSDFRRYIIKNIFNPPCSMLDGNITDMLKYAYMKTVGLFAIGIILGIGITVGSVL